MSAVIIAHYLDFSETSALKKALDTAEVEYFVRRHGLPIFLGTVHATYRVYVKPDVAEKAQRIATEFLSDLKKNRAEFEAKLLVACPVCNSTNIYVQPKKSLWQKLYYMGVTVRRCKECDSEWYT